jgi:hypothetical protein
MENERRVAGVEWGRNSTVERKEIRGRDSLLKL